MSTTQMAPLPDSEQRMVETRKAVRAEPARFLLCVLPYLVSQPEVPVPGKSVRSFLAFPYGVLSIASYLKAKAAPPAEIQILDLNLFATTEERGAELARLLVQINPHVVGFSMSYDISYSHVSVLTQVVKRFDSKILTLMGGPAVTTAWQEILAEQQHVDALCYSEGERAMLALAQSSDFASELQKNPWVTRKSLLNRTCPQAVVLENLDEVIPADYELLDTARYSMKEAFSPFVSYRNQANVRQFFIVTSRGCPFKCVFCAEPSFHGKSIRYAGIDAIIGHVRDLVEKYGMNVLTLYDDQLLMDQRRAKDLFRRLAEFKIRVEMPNGITLAFIDDELAFLMKQAGVDTVFLAIESGSDYVLRKIVKKPVRLDKVKGVIDSLRKNEIFVQSFFIIGFPGETDEHREETRTFIAEVGIDWCFFNFATPLRGSELFKICIEQGWVDKKFIGIGHVDMSEYIIRSPGIDPQKITDQIYRMNLEANFVNNYRMKIGDYSTAKRCFEEVLERHPDHPFALYFLAKAQEALGVESESTDRNFRRYEAILVADPRWKSLAVSFALPTKIQ